MNKKSTWMWRFLIYAQELKLESLEKMLERSLGALHFSAIKTLKKVHSRRTTAGKQIRA